uniref:Mevalonate kinase n=1 Tax=Phlebotomus papatasi TaxID=29031 RepID=A0A1B0CYD0_PHLPP
MVKFEVSAPGKVILHGEHSVVYGKPAVAGVVQVRNTLKLEVNDNKSVEICFPKIGLDVVTFPLEVINKFLSTCTEKYGALKLPESINHGVFLGEVQQFVRENVTGISKNDLDTRELNSLSATVYLLVGILIEGQTENLQKGFTINLKTEMSVGAGLGSSASFGVCLAAAFYFLVRLLEKESFLEDFQNLSETQQHDVKQRISTWAFYSEKIMHGNPSGLDNTICTFGNVVKFYKGHPPVDIKLACSLPILLVDSGVGRSTAKLVEKVTDLRARHTKLVDNIFEAMKYLVEDAVDILEHITHISDTENFHKLENLVSMNNNLLRSLGVSHPALEKIFVIAEKYGFHAKLSGAGGGGFAMILLPSWNIHEMKNFRQLKDDLEKNNFQWILTGLGGEGLTFRNL